MFVLWKVMALLFADIQEMIAGELIDGKYSRAAALSVFAIHKPRIFEQGRDANGNLIGQYVDGPYKELRREKGRETGFVNLSMTEQMKRDYQPSLTGLVGYGFTNQFNLDKSYWNEERYDKEIFALSDAEATMFIDLVGQLMFPE